MNSLILIIVASMIPVVEARGAFIIAFINKVSDVAAFITIFIFSSIPSLFLIHGLSAFENNFVKKNNLLEKTYMHIINRVRSKSVKITRFRVVYIGLSLFVAVPLPGTGVWTGSILSYILGLDKKLSILSIILGNLISCVILYVSIYFIGSVVFRN